MKRLALLLLVLIGCGLEVEPPPYPVYYCAGTPAEDVALWQGAMDEWETQVGRGELFVEQPGERPAGACGIVICAAADLPGDRRATYYPGGACTARIVYEPNELFVTRQHELGHALGLDHARSGTMKPGDASQNVVKPEDGARVRRRWGMP